MKCIYPLLLATLLIAFSCKAPEVNKEEILNSRIERIESNLQPSLQIEGEAVPRFNLDDRLGELGIPGLSIAVAVNGQIEWARGYGYADKGENKMVDTATMFLAGSISKPVSAVRAHQLVEKGVFSLDGDVNDVLLSWKVPENEFTTNEKVTLRRILNHTAGLTVWGFPGYDKGDSIPTVVEVLNGEGNTDSVRVYKEPGESWMYSGGGYTIMQLMITNAEGTSFPETLQKNVLDPMGMAQSTFENPLPVRFHAIAATGYRTNGNEVEGKWPIYPEMAAAGLWTTPSQLIQYGIEIQEIYQTEEDGILKYETVREMLTPGMNGHGLGPGVGDHTFGHGGADEGFRARLVAWKDLPYVVVIMVNSDNGRIIQELLLSVVEEYDLPGMEPDIKTILKLSPEDLKKYTGRYEVEEYGPMEISVFEDHLLAEASFIDEPIHLLAENDTLFFDRSDGTQLDFELANGKVQGFSVQGLEAKKVE